MSRRWAEIHDFAERQNSRSKIRWNRRSFSLTLPITLFLAILIALGGWLWLWLLGGAVLWQLYKVLYYDDWTFSFSRRRKKSIGFAFQGARPGAPGACSQPHPTKLAAHNEVPAVRRNWVLRLILER